MTSDGRLATPLADIGVLVTRPVEQAERLMSRLHDLGARPFLFPALEIAGPKQPLALHALLAKAEQYDWMVFVSPTAVQFGLLALNQAAPAPAVSRIKAAAVGSGTAAALRSAGFSNVLAPESGADSEHLLALPEFADLAGQRILIFRGEGGRELIAATLRARGAEVEYAECYRRRCPHRDPTPLHEALRQRRIHATTVFSGETLDNLVQLAGTQSTDMLRALPLFVPHPRIAEHAQTLDFAQTRVTGAGESGLLAGLVEYFRND